MIDTSKIHLGFLKISGANRKLLPSHISLFTAMVICCQMQGSIQPFRVCRNELMKLSAIRSYNTYHNCIKELVRQGYIDYLPSYSTIIASRVSFKLGP
ncbi:hypothetical protein [Pedobacter nanyangensis]|uniref:hypothetical protein n=1 Tax=Pedobacter nanyangensis TaxID=1562389 RepID=UPI000DE2C38F|nr:hypothetical protein [Pedobacter nanyangensis]